MSTLNPDSWCILKTAPSRTLVLFMSLAKSGFEVWTPVEVRVKRLGRRRKRVEHSAPITPGFVFARFADVTRLATITRTPGMLFQRWDSEQRRMVQDGLPVFQVFRDGDRYPQVRDEALDPLREIERRCRPKVKANAFGIGEAVKYEDAGFEGLVAQVVGYEGRYALVEYSGLPFTVKIDARYLLPTMRAA